ncbi:FAD/NAD(P)-binding domain-containing protein [Didymella exigua CBS 183.55]|uniref:FAD/NAD(P)-binding domain-containing protein n=1 Tax=Didymella exigua CBS 183.55 TaxID=1150837 RepID=A0A6A5RUW9_9PLEO|nr:FAD/NAD(P)-binding domain-containing protein [Didymella exigua CBS 183.55]KAF1931160.1 FAD/NAD(P)-binding domain-containing protein [Didymella exigua CBS 183.55]
MIHEETKIAIVGAGPAGMVALKEFRDLGFEVTVFEKKDDVGGVWTWSEDLGSTTALKETRLCNNKYSLTLGDYPYPEDFPWTVSAPELGAHFHAYAKHFDLYRNIRFKKTVTKLTRDHSNNTWQLKFSDAPSIPLSFDKIVWATGGFVQPKGLILPGQDEFEGRIIHSSQARDLSTFKDQKVIVLGIGNTAADVANALVKHNADTIWLSHRRGAKILNPSDPKTDVPSDVMLTTSLLPVTWFLQKHCPSVYGWMMDSAIAQNFKDSWGENRDEWGLAQSPSLGDGQHVVVCSQDLVPNIKSGKIRSVPGIKRITGPNSVEFDDGCMAEGIDAIILCIGYGDDIDILKDAIEFTPTQNGGPELPNLYMNIFPPAYASSFAHISLTHLLGPQIPGRVLAAMAIPQIWANRSPLPSTSTMTSWISTHQSWVRRRIAKVGPNGNGYQEVDNGEWSYFLHEAAGTGLYEHVGWGWRAWRLWWNDRELYRAISNLPICAYSFRVFDTGKRKPWAGARQALVDAYRELVELQTNRGKKKQ